MRVTTRCTAPHSDVLTRTQGKPDGVFLLRDSSSMAGGYVLSVRSGTPTHVTASEARMQRGSARQQLCHSEAGTVTVRHGRAAVHQRVPVHRVLQAPHPRHVSAHQPHCSCNTSHDITFNAFSQPWDEKFVSGVPVMNILGRVKANYNFPAKARHSMPSGSCSSRPAGPRRPVVCQGRCAARGGEARGAVVACTALGEHAHRHHSRQLRRGSQHTSQIA